MRTKTLVLTAAFVAAGAATSMAQVYSQNVVGYVNVSVPKKAGALITYAALANPLNGTNNNINTVLPSVPDFTQVFVFVPGTGFSSPETYIGGAWDPGTTVLAPGSGFFIVLDNSTAANPQVVTFVGEVPQGQLNTPIPNGYSLVSSKVPQAGLLTQTLLFTPPDQTQVFQWDVINQKYFDPFTYLDGVGWDPSEPSVAVAEGFFVFNTLAASSWNRNFTVQ